MAKLVFVWACPQVRINMREVMSRRNFAPHNEVQYVRFMQPAYRNKEDNEVLVFGTSIDTIGMCRTLDLLKQEPELRYVAINIEGTSQEVYHAWSSHLLSQYPNLKFFDPKVGGNVFDALRSEVSHA